MKKMFQISASLALVIGISTEAYAQSVSLGADLVSRYVWRGTDFGESASIQPSLAISGSGLEIGTWASYSISEDGAGANEHDIWVGYSADLGTAGSLSLGVTDYYFPAPDGGDFSNFEGNGDGSHWIEPYVGYTLGGGLPLSFYGAIMVHNDPDNSLYIEASVPASIGGVEMGFTAGLVAGESEFYAVESASVVNLGVSGSKDLTLVDGGFVVPVSVAYILNPTSSRSFLVFGLSISL